MGTPQFAVPPLEKLIGFGIDVQAVVTVADKPAGRGRKLVQSPVKQCALEHNIPVLQPVSLKDEGFLNTLKKIQADLFIVVAFRMLPKVVWSMPPLGTFNLHGSLLPKYRGAAPIHWAVINGDHETGLTTFLLDEKIDTGQLLLQKKIEIPTDWTTGQLHDALMPLGADLVLETTLGLFKKSLEPIEQDPILASHAPKLFKENTTVPLDAKPEDVRNFIRGLSPFPGAHISGYKLLNSKLSDTYKSSPYPKLMTENKKLYFVYPLGCLEITRIKAPGKREMDGRSFANGLHGTEIKLA